MQRNTSLWIYFVSLLLAAGMTFALLPACGGGDGDSCNSELRGDACEDEEDGEEIVESTDEDDHEFREETGEPSSEEIMEHEIEDAREIAP